MIFRIGKDNRLYEVADADEKIYEGKEGYIVVEEVPEALYPLYKLDGAGAVVPDDDRILEKARAVKLKEIKGAFKDYLESGYTCSNGIHMDATFNDIIKFKFGIELFEKLGSQTVVVRDY